MSSGAPREAGDVPPAGDGAARAADRLRAELGDEPDAALIDAAKQVFGSRAVASTLAVLASDRLSSGDDPPEDHVLVFRALDTSVRVRVSGPPGARRISVDLGSGASEARLESPSWPEARRADSDLSFGEVPAAVVRITAVLPEGRRVHTDWFRV